MKVVFAADAIRPPLTGVGRYAWELAKRIAGMPGVEELRFFRGGRLESELPALPVGDGLDAGSRLRRVLLRSNAVVAAYRALIAYRQTAALIRVRGHVFHSPNFYLPRSALPSVATFHDLSVFKWPECHPPERVRYMVREIPLAAKRASYLITDSEFTRREVIDYFGWPAERIRAIPLAASGNFRPRKASGLEPVLSRYGLKAGEYSLYSGSIEPRKNIGSLLDAYESMPAAVKRRWPLVLAGYAGWSSEALHRRIQSLAAAGWVKYLGFVPDEVLPQLYSGARAFCLPSFYEGFGLPVLEAMASGVPVVCSSSASLPEVAGDAAAQCEARDIDGLRMHVLRALEDDGWREGAIRRGLVRAAGFSWERTAGETVQVYAEIAASQ